MRTLNRFRFLKQNIGYYILAAMIVLGLKYTYSRAQSEDLNWILYPTSHVVKLLSGLEFEAEAHEGYINRDKGVIIAPSCAGVNFLIIAFCMGLFSFVHRFRGHWKKIIWFGGMMIGAYGVTIGVNTVRIILAIWLYDQKIHFGWLTAGRLHRMEGVAVYFIFLFLFYTLLERVSERCVQNRESNHNLLKHPLTPLFWYFLITIAVPILNRAYLSNFKQFIEHCMVTILICSAVLFMIYLIRKRLSHNVYDSKSG